MRRGILRLPVLRDAIVSPKFDVHQRRAPLIRVKRHDARRVGIGPSTRAIHRVQAMQRISSYVGAAVVIGGLVLATGVLTADLGLWARASGPYRAEARPVGADGPLKTCVVCHSVEEGGPLRVAPPLHGIVGAKKARADWYGYSPALRQAGGTWSEADLDKYLTAPSKFLPGTTKTIIGIKDDKERADIIAALKKGS